MAELLLQRTQARQVVETFESFRSAFPTPRAVLEASEKDVAAALFRLGLHSRAKVLRDLASIALESGGIPPEDEARLRGVRGVGTYTASAWLSLHRGKRAAIVDANVYRWFGRMFGRPYGRDPRRVRWVRDVAEAITPQRSFRDFNYAVLDFTMNVCLPRSPKCGRCPFSASCVFAKANVAKRRLDRRRAT